MQERYDSKQDVRDDDDIPCDYKIEADPVEKGNQDIPCADGRIDAVQLRKKKNQPEGGEKQDRKDIDLKKKTDRFRNPVNEAADPGRGSFM